MATLREGRDLYIRYGRPPLERKSPPSWHVAARSPDNGIAGLKTHHQAESWIANSWVTYEGRYTSAVEVPPVYRKAPQFQGQGLANARRTLANAIERHQRTKKQQQRDQLKEQLTQTRAQA